MDILKILSRSTKHVNKSAGGKDTSSVKVPSAGTSSNPQLYNDAIPESRGKKRKRRAEQNEEDAPGDKDETIDFFATKVAPPKSKTPRSADQRPQASETVSQAKL